MFGENKLYTRKQHFPNQISGPFAAFLQEQENTWSYSNEGDNYFNILTTQAFWIHKHYLDIMVWALFSI